MKNTTTLLAVCGALALAAVGCVGELEPLGPGDVASPADAGNPVIPPGNPTGDEAEALFIANAHPALQASCGQGNACHTTTTPTFAVADSTASYAQVTGQIAQLAPGYNIEGAKLLEYGQIPLHKPTSAHLPDAIISIENWLRAEKLKIDQGGVIETSALAKWSGCMNLDEFEELDVADLWADKGSQDGDCDACHNLGAEFFIASNQGVRVFNNLTTNPTLMQSYFTLDATGTSVVINRARIESVALRLAPHQGHPQFNVDGNAYEALVAFYDLTMLRFNSALPADCAPVRFPTQ